MFVSYFFDFMSVLNKNCVGTMFCIFFLISCQSEKNMSRDCKLTFYEHSQNTKLLYKKYYFGIEKYISCLGFKKLKTCSDCDTNQNYSKLTLSSLQILQDIKIST
jgi:hypothetical protein